MAVTIGAALFPARSSPVRRRNSAGRSTPLNPISPRARNVLRRISVSTDEAPSIVAREGGERNWLEEAEEAEESEKKRRGWREYCEQAEEMMMVRSDGGPPRWFSPLECSPSPAERSRGGGGAPLLLYLPGADGVGVGLLLLHEKLAKMFDVWCLHIPLMDRTPFTELVKLVERTVKSENNRSPNRPIYLVGESLGACLALAIAARNPDIDLMLILANPATSFNQSLLQHLLPLLEVMPDQAHLSLPYVLSVMTGDSLGKAVATLSKGLPLQQTVGELSQDLAAVSSYLSVLAGTVPKETLLWKLKMLKEASAFANSRLHSIKAQTLLLSSGNDQFLPSQVECERLRRALPKSAIRHFNDSGHFLFLDGGVDLVTAIKGASFYRRSKNLDYVKDFVPPTPSEFKKIHESNRWVYLATSPTMFSTLESGKIVKGLAGIPSEGPVLLVGYHSLLGLELVPLVSQILIQRNILVRGIAHPMMFTKSKDDGLLPDVSSFDTFRTMGAVPVSATNFFKLFSSKSHVLLYPGGMREALHRKGEEYKLFWPEQSEFVRMAARFGAKIVPFGVVGEDDFGQVVFDYDDLMKIPYFKTQIEGLTNEAEKLRTNANGEVANQDVHLPGILPKIPGGRFYYYFGKPIETAGRKKELKDREKSHELYLQVKSEVEKCLAYLKEKRESDPYRSLVPRLLYQITHGFESEVPTFEP